ncbi:MAG: 50S ribosomal protein L30 [Candidatus Latescibacteria bacterium]|nr:50S ribosomal protein L30 [Candidatus Latescibacterota bacterium]
MGVRVKVTQRRSAIGRERRQRETLRALGIHRMHQSVVHEDTPQIRGMIFRVKHLVEVEKIEEHKAG